MLVDLQERRKKLDHALISVKISNVLMIKICLTDEKDFLFIFWLNNGTSNTQHLNIPQIYAQIIFTGSIHYFQCVN